MRYGAFGLVEVVGSSNAIIVTDQMLKTADVSFLTRNGKCGGHETVFVTGDVSAVTAAVQAVKDVDGILFICADHGNAEQLIDYETGEPWTAHTTNPVPFILVNADPKYTLRENGCLADIIPTLIQLMGMEQPAEMTGESLLVEK